MPQQLQTLFELNSELEQLDMVQEWINASREAAPYNQTVQARLDYEQARVNTKRRYILAKQYHIASSN